MNQIIVNLLTTIQSHNLAIDILNNTTKSLVKQAKKSKLQIGFLSGAAIGTWYTLQNHKKNIVELKKRLADLEDRLSNCEDSEEENDFREI